MWFHGKYIYITWCKNEIWTTVGGDIGGATPPQKGLMRTLEWVCWSFWAWSWTLPNMKILAWTLTLSMSLQKKKHPKSAGRGPSVYAPIARTFNKLPDGEKQKLKLKFDIANIVATENLPLLIIKYNIASTVQPCFKSARTFDHAIIKLYFDLYMMYTYVIIILTIYPVLLWQRSQHLNNKTNNSNNGKKTQVSQTLRIKISMLYLPVHREYPVHNILFNSYIHYSKSH